jgi:arylsulfatase A-like enzyme
LRAAWTPSWALLAVLGGCGGSHPAAGEDDRPDVVLVLVDTLRADRTAVLADGPPTPVLAALGRSGIVYSQAIAPAAWTLPSVAALFAGRDASGNRHDARRDLPALAEHFARAGYRTIGLVANPLLTAENGFARGFDDYTVAPASSTADLAADVHALRAWNADALVARALSALAAVPAGRPALLYLHLMDTHVPYDPAYDTAAPPWPGWSEAEPGDEPPLVTWCPTTALSDAQRALLSGWRRAYDGQVRFADAAIGRLVERLPEVRSRLALVAVTSDHGEGLFSHRRGPGSTPGPGPLGEAYPDHGEQLYEEALRVPLWLAGPGVPAGRREERPVALRDLAATLLHLARVGGPDASRPTRLPLDRADPVPEAVCGAGTRGWFVRTATRKLTVPFGTSAPDRDPGVLLHAVDGGRYLPEIDDLSAGEPAVRRELLQLWGRWLDASDEPPPEPPDSEMTERLRMLGYVR